MAAVAARWRREATRAAAPWRIEDFDGARFFDFRGTENAVTSVRNVSIVQNLTVRFRQDGWPVSALRFPEFLRALRDAEASRF
jgi:hypothetical protein